MDSNKIKGTVAICTPMYGDHVHRTYVNSLLLLADALRSNGYAMNLVSLGHDGSTAKAKNLAINIATRSNDLLGVVFLDANVGVSPQDVLSLVESNKDVIGALVPRKVINWEQVKNSIILKKSDVELYSGNFDIELVDSENISISHDTPIPVKYVSSDLLYVSINALNKLKSSSKSFYHQFSEQDDSVQEVVEYFRTSISEDTKEFLSEDETFSKLWRETGESVWVAPWIDSVRSGDYNFSGSFLHSVDLLSDIKWLTR